MCSVPTQIEYLKHLAWISKRSICFRNSPSLVQKRMFRSQSMQTSFTQGGHFGHIKSPYPEHKRTEVLGLPPDDDCDPSDEQQQQHSHCCEHGVSREHLAGPLGQAQAQDEHQENLRWRRTISSRKQVSPPSSWSRADPLHSGVAEVSLGGRELSTQSPTEEGDPRLTGSLEQSLEHWVSQGGCS